MASEKEVHSFTRCPSAANNSPTRLSSSSRSSNTRILPLRVISTAGRIRRVVRIGIRTSSTPTSPLGIRSFRGAGGVRGIALGGWCSGRWVVRCPEPTRSLSAPYQSGILAIPRNAAPEPGRGGPARFPTVLQPFFFAPSLVKPGTARHGNQARLFPSCTGNTPRGAARETIVQESRALATRTGPNASTAIRLPEGPVPAGVLAIARRPSEGSGRPRVSGTCPFLTVRIEEDRVSKK